MTKPFKVRKHDFMAAVITHLHMLASCCCARSATAPSNQVNHRSPAASLRLTAARQQARHGDRIPVEAVPRLSRVQRHRPRQGRRPLLRSRLVRRLHQHGPGPRLELAGSGGGRAGGSDRHRFRVPFRRFRRGRSWGTRLGREGRPGRVLARNQVGRLPRRRTCAPSVRQCVLSHPIPPRGLAQIEAEALVPEATSQELQGLPRRQSSQTHMRRGVPCVERRRQGQYPCIPVGRSIAAGTGGKAGAQTQKPPFNE